MAETFKLALILKAFDGVTAPLRQINSALDQVQKPLRNFEKAFGNFKESSGFNRLGQSLAGVKAATMNVGSAVFSLASKFALVGGVAAGIFGKMVNDTVESASKLVDLSSATGASVESIQRLGYAFEQSGGSTEDFQSGLVKFSKNLGDARKKSGPLFQFLSKNDKPLLQKMLNTKDTGEAMTLFIDKLSQAKTDTERLSASTAAVGKTANVALAALAKDGPENLRSLMAETPGVLSKEQAVRAEAFGDVIGKLSKRFQSLALPVVASVLPALKSLAENLETMLRGKEEAIKNWAADFGEKLPGRIEIVKNAFAEFWEMLKPVRDAITWVTSDSDRLHVALGVLAAIVAGPVIGSIGALASSVVSFGIALLTTPIGWFTLAVSALVGIGYLVYTRWQAIKEFFITIWDSPAGKLFQFLSPIGWLINAGIFIYKNWETVKSYFVKLWDSPLGKLLAFTSPIGWLIKAGQYIYNNWEKVGALFEKAFGYAKKFFGFGEDGAKITTFSEVVSAPPGASDWRSSYSNPMSDALPNGSVLDSFNNDGMNDLLSATNQINETMEPIAESIQNQKSISSFSSTADPEGMQKLLAGYNIQQPAPTPPPQIITKEASVRVTFENMPQGTRVEKDPKSEAPLNLNLGYSGVS